MSVLINIKETMSSLQIAEITGKRHDNVMRDIRNLLEQGVAALNFEESYYKSEQNKDIQCFNLTKKGCLILASGYDAKLREQIIDRWEELETKNQSGGFSIPTSFKEALLLAAHQQEQIEEKQKLIEEKQAQIEVQAPKVAFANAMEAAKTTCLIGELAKILTQNGYTIGQNRLFKWLRDNHYLGTKGENYNIPNQQYLEQGLFELKKGVRSGHDGVMHHTTTVKVTGKGQSYFINKLIPVKKTA